MTLLRFIIAQIDKGYAAPASSLSAAYYLSGGHNTISRTAPRTPSLLALALALWLLIIAIAAASASPAANAPDQELDEVVVTAKRSASTKRIRDPAGLTAWLNRLRGDFTYEGLVELSGEAAPRRQIVSGATRCGAYGPSVSCALHVTWQEVHGSDGEDVPGVVSTLAPAMAIYAVDLNYLGIQFLQVDSRGMADSGLGYLTGDTLTTTTACVDLEGDCRRISRIEARPDGKLIRMETDIEQDEKRLVRYTFVLRRQERAKR